ncbi:ornithine aminomutase subunit alpha [Anaerophilus nitritogenes]|uniref:ornithine aminomutase subunit alpha n=1 Tax=Anaerophilus nitritogenes TaxID=2498136 RepID=UPI00101C1F25|nr:ornithine aminomutase subunit alpha [Anaerophilus nitritogenes]
MKRADDFEKRRDHLKNLTDEELKQRFWELANQLVDPLLDLAYKNTSPSIERSILLRMGFSSMEAKAIVEGVRDRGLMGKGAGHVVYKLAKTKNIDIRDAGVALSNGEYWDEVIDLFKGGVQSEA